MSGVLAGELSLLGALAAQHLARAHRQAWAWLKPEPLHHHESIFAIEIIIIDLENITVPESAVELLRVRIGYPHFQLDGGCKFEHELVLNPL